VTRALPLLALAILGLAPGAGRAEADERLPADGKEARVTVRTPGAAVALAFETVAGARYRLRVVPDTLERPVLEIARPGEAAHLRVEASERGATAEHLWEAETSGLLEARVSGFSALTGTARVRLETVDPEGRRVTAHRRFLAPGGELAHVGELLLRGVNRWVLRAEPGTAYEIAPTEGSAGRVLLRVLGPGGEVLADSEASSLAWLAHPPVRFRAPPPAAGAADAEEPGALVLEVRGLFDGGGTYGVRMRALGEGESLDPASAEPPAPVEAGPIEAEPGAFSAGPGDLAVLFVPETPLTRVVEVRRGERWVRVEGAGQGASARSQENALLVWFRPYYPGEYRFADPFGGPPGGDLSLLDRASLGGAPIHLGTGVDPTVAVRLGSKWELVGLGCCMPGWDYLFVLADGPEAGVGMRVADRDGKVIATRKVGGAGAPVAPGFGPSLRFRLARHGIVRFEARASRPWTVRPLLRRASN
jgi:hypothetical protein